MSDGRKPLTILTVITAVLATALMVYAAVLGHLELAALNGVIAAVNFVLVAIQLRSKV